MEADPIGAGDTLGRYELLVPIAQGGTAAIWAARWHDDPRRIVALKMMLTELIDEESEGEGQEMLLDEARTVSRIKHPNVAEMHEVGEAEGIVFLVMEFVDGEPLHVVARESAKRGPMPVQIAVGLAKQVAAGLHAAHELVDERGVALGIVHRDVSPQNLVVGFDGMVKIVDFGVAKAASNLNRTTVGQIKGKAGFMAPEQARGAGVDRRTDVFALGVVLYQLLAGAHPFRGDNEFATMLRIADPRPADPLTNVRPDCPPALAAVIACALEKSKEARFATMMDFEAALSAAVPGAADVPTIRAYLAPLIGARVEKRRAAIREAIAEANRKNPAQRAVVDAHRVSRASERPLAGGPDDSEVMDRAALAGAQLQTPQAGPSGGPTAPSNLAGGFPIDDEISMGDVRGFKSRSAPVLAMLAIVAVCALVYLMLRD